jgi:hypothetical protein
MEAPMRRALLSLATIGIASLGSTLPTLGQPLGTIPPVLVEAKQSSLVTTVHDWRCCTDQPEYYAPPAYYPPQAYYVPPAGYAPPVYYPPETYYPPQVVYTLPYLPESYYYNFHRSQKQNDEW